MVHREGWSIICGVEHDLWSRVYSVVHRLECNTQCNAVEDMNTYVEAVDNRCRRIGRTVIVRIKMASYYNKNII